MLKKSCFILRPLIPRFQDGGVLFDDWQLFWEGRGGDVVHFSCKSRNVKTRLHSGNRSIGEGRVRFICISEIQNFINREWCFQHPLEKRIGLKYFLYASLVPKEKSRKIISSSARKIISRHPSLANKVINYLVSLSLRDFLPDTRWRCFLLNSRPFSSKFAWFSS